MQGKRGLIMGLANDKSLAWGIAKALHGAGAELAISYQGDVMLKRVKPLADQLGCDFLIDCDVADMANLDTAFATLSARWPQHRSSMSRATRSHWPATLPCLPAMVTSCRKCALSTCSRTLTMLKRWLYLLDSHNCRYSQVIETNQRM